MKKRIEKVTGFVTRTRPNGTDLLLFRHPYAGIQIPAGTVEPGETPEQAVLREVSEETGLENLILSKNLGAEDESLPPDCRVILEPTRVYARPDLESFDWAFIRPGITVTAERRMAGFTQIKYQEPDRLPDPQYTTLLIQGWVPDTALTDTRRRHYFQLGCQQDSPNSWVIKADNHVFSAFWAPLKNLPEIVPPQDIWLTHLHKHLNK